MYFEDREKEKLFKVGKDLTLLEVLKHERFVFLIVKKQDSADSNFVLFSSQHP